MHKCVLSFYPHGFKSNPILIALLIFEEELCVENKRPKGIGIGASDGPISLDDFRSLQKSNTVL